MHQSLIFIVDDDPVFSNILGMKLEQHGYTNLEFHLSGEECLEAISNNPEFVFLDYNLEGINGLETLKKIKEVNRSIDVFIVTTSSEVSIRETCLENGANLFINKNSLLRGFPEEIKDQLVRKRK